MLKCINVFSELVYSWKTSYICSDYDNIHKLYMQHISTFLDHGRLHQLYREFFKQYACHSCGLHANEYLLNLFSKYSYSGIFKYNFIRYLNICFSISLLRLIQTKNTEYSKTKITICLSPTCKYNFLFL